MALNQAFKTDFSLLYLEFDSYLYFPLSFYIPMGWGGALAAMRAGLFAPMPAVKHEDHILSQAVCCMHDWNSAVDGSSGRTYACCPQQCGGQMRAGSQACGAPPLPPQPAAMDAQRRSAKLCAACRTGTQQWMEAEGAPAVSSNAEG